jgi:predicted glutamine amidotransferase
VHLRWATDGLEVEPANTHPFADGDRALAHNGSIAPISELESLLTAAQRERLAGTTDSERYFRFVLQCIEEAGDEREGVVRAVEVLRRRFPRSSLNALLLTPSHLFAVHVNTAAATPLDDLRELFDSEEAMPPGHATQYFDLAYRVSPTSVHVVSSGLTDDGWTPVPPDCVLAVDTAGRDLEILALAARVPAQ